MKNLENYGVQELSVKEQQNTEGGFLWLAILAVVGLGFIIGNAIGNSFDNCD